VLRLELRVPAEHVFYETDLRVSPRSAGAVWYRLRGEAPTLEELRSYYLPPASRASGLSPVPVPADAALQEGVDAARRLQEWEARQRQDQPSASSSDSLL